MTGEHSCRATTSVQTATRWVLQMLSWHGGAADGVDLGSMGVGDERAFVSVGEPQRTIVVGLRGGG